MAKELGRSVSGVCKTLKEESYPVQTNKKVNSRTKDEIGRRYFHEGRSAPETALKLGLAKQTVLHWLKGLDNPIPVEIRGVADSRSVVVSSNGLDLLRSPTRSIYGGWMTPR